MAVGYNPKVVADSLVLSLDASSPKNYNVGVSTNWVDKIGGNNGTPYGRPHHNDGPFVGAGYVEFDGNTDKLSCTPSNLTGQFTIEGWWYATAFTSASVFFGKWGYECLLRKNGSNIEWYSAGNVSGVTATYTFNTGQWYHLAVSRDSSNVHRVFINGVQVLSTTDSDSITMTDFCIGAQSTGSTTDDIWTGYISNFRIVNGTALYTSNFTVPTKSLTAVPNTTLLTCQGNTIADASSSALSITIGGDAAARLGFPASAFEFDGSNPDYVLAAANPDLNWGTEDFTVELWANVSSSTGFGTLFATEVNAQEEETNTFTIAMNSSRRLGVIAFSSYLISNSAATQISQNTWTHIVVTRQGTTLTMYIDKSSVATVTNSTNFVAGGYAIGTLPRSPSNTNFTGKVSNVRVYKGKALTLAEIEQNYNATKGRFE